MRNIWSKQGRNAGQFLIIANIHIQNIFGAIEAFEKVLSGQKIVNLETEIFTVNGFKIFPGKCILFLTIMVILWKGRLLGRYNKTKIG